jgi:hypothetical protein
MAKIRHNCLSELADSRRVLPIVVKFFFGCGLFCDFVNWLPATSGGTFRSNP